MATYAEKVATLGATHFWKLDETAGTTADDAIGTKDGTLTGGTLGVAGPTAVAGSKAFRIGATNSDYVIFTNAADLPLANTSRTWTCWAKTTRTGNAVLISYGNGSSGQVYSYLLNLSGKDLAVATYFGDGGVADADANDGNWHHFAITYDGTTNEFFRDGVSKGTYARGSSIDTKNNFFKIGALCYATNFYLDGDICLVACFGSVLSSSDIASLAAGDDPINEQYLGLVVT